MRHRVVGAFVAELPFGPGNPVGNIDDATVGTIQTLAGDPRIMQFAVRLEF